MDKQTMMLELKGLSRVVNKDVTNLVLKRRVIEELADGYEPLNPFFAMMDTVEDELSDMVQRNIFEHLSEGERTAFRSQWNEMRPDQQMSYLNSYVAGD